MLLMQISEPKEHRVSVSTSLGGLEPEHSQQGGRARCGVPTGQANASVPDVELDLLLPPPVHTRRCPRDPR
jgi:hypothetical protein